MIQQRPCPYCRLPMLYDATVCANCGRTSAVPPRNIRQEGVDVEAGFTDATGRLRRALKPRWGGGGGSGSTGCVLLVAMTLVLAAVSAYLLS
jgi:hypothetical protein